MIISIEELRTLLKIQGIETELTDEELKTLIEFKTREINGYIGCDIENTIHTQHDFKFNGDTVLLLHYPVDSISSVAIDNTLIPAKEYYLNSEDGILSFITPLYGELNIVYKSSLPNWVISNILIPLLIDMIVYILKDKNNLADITSMSEGGINISYNNSTSLGIRIQNRLRELQNYFGAKLRVI